MGANALCALLCCCALAVSTAESAGKAKIVGQAIALAGGCKEAAECVWPAREQFTRFVANAGRSDDPVEEFCAAAAARAECLQRCPDEPPAHSLVRAGNAIDAFVCHEKKEEFKEAAACLKGSEGLKHGSAACAQCRDRVHTIRMRWRLIEEMQRTWGNITVAGYVRLLNADDGLAAQACGTMRCALTCLESVSEEHCGDRRHGELVRELVRLFQSEAAGVVQHLGLGCLVPDVCKPSAN